MDRVGQSLLTCKSVDSEKFGGVRTDLANYSPALALPHSESKGNAQHSFLAPAYCCSFTVLLKLPEEFAQVYASYQRCTKGRKSSAAWTLSVLPHACDLGKL